MRRCGVVRRGAARHGGTDCPVHFSAALHVFTRSGSQLLAHTHSGLWPLLTIMSRLCSKISATSAFIRHLALDPPKSAIHTRVEEKGIFEFAAARGRVAAQSSCRSAALTRPEPEKCRILLLLSPPTRRAAHAASLAQRSDVRGHGADARQQRRSALGRAPLGRRGLCELIIQRVVRGVAPGRIRSSAPTAETTPHQAAPALSLNGLLHHVQAGPRSRRRRRGGHGDRDGHTLAMSTQHEWESGVLAVWGHPFGSLPPTTPFHFIAMRAGVHTPPRPPRDPMAFAPQTYGSFNFSPQCSPPPASHDQARREAELAQKEREVAARERKFEEQRALLLCCDYEALRQLGRPNWRQAPAQWHAFGSRLFLCWVLTTAVFALNFLVEVGLDFASMNALAAGAAALADDTNDMFASSDATASGGALGGSSSTAAAAAALGGGGGVVDTMSSHAPPAPLLLPLPLPARSAATAPPLPGQSRHQQQQWRRLPRRRTACRSPLSGGRHLSMRFRAHLTRWTNWCGQRREQTVLGGQSGMATSFSSAPVVAGLAGRIHSRKRPW